ncbi:hypothetical protein NKG94_05865 [Micromonospora sp. M12]
MADRVQQQFHTQWSTLGWAAANKREVLDGYFDIWTDALAQGRAGALEPNEVVQPTNEVQFPVPDLTIRSYFLLPDRQLADVRRLVERLRRMDVEVYEVQKPTRVPTARVFGGRSATNVTVPRARTGSRWTSRRSTGSRPSWARTRTCRSPTSTTCRPGATRC